MRINNNVMAMNTYRQLNKTTGSQSKSMEKLSSGYRINRAGDDAAGLSISEKMRGQIRGLQQASSNAQDGISLIQTAEGALSETQDILQRMRELTVQAANDTNVTADRTAIQNEITELTAEITRIAEKTEFNKRTLLNGGTMSSSGITFQIGANASTAMGLTIGSMSATGLTISTTTVSVDSYAHAQASITNIDTAIEKVSAQRSKLGAAQNRLEHTISNLDNTAENMQAAESRVRDVDMAKEMMEYTKDNILQQAAQSMLAQANQAPQGVLQLLG